MKTRLAPTFEFVLVSLLIILMFFVVGKFLGEVFTAWYFHISAEAVAGRGELVWSSATYTKVNILGGFFAFAAYGNFMYYLLRKGLVLNKSRAQILSGKQMLRELVSAVRDLAQWIAPYVVYAAVVVASLWALSTIF